MEIIRFSTKEVDRHKMGMDKITRQNHKRCTTMDLHEWTENDTVLSYYYTKYGLKNLWLRTEQELCDFIGTTTGSLIKQSMNIRWLMGYQTKVLSDYSKLQHQVHDLLSICTYNEVFILVKEIINQDEEIRKDEFSKRGLDYTKFKMVS